MHSHNRSEDSPSLGERILVEKSQDSVQVTKQRMQRRSTNAGDDAPPQDTADGRQADAQQRVLFSDDAVEVGSSPKKGRGSIGKRLSAALGFKKKSPLAAPPGAGAGPVLGSSPSSPRVKFEQRAPEIIGQGGPDALAPGDSPAAGQP